MSGVAIHSVLESGLPWLLIPGWPLFVALLLLTSASARCAKWLAPWAALPALLAALFAPSHVYVDLPWLLLGTRLGVDETSRIFLLFTATLWLAAGWYGRSYFAGDARRNQVLVFFLAAMAGNLGLIVSLDMVSFYCFFALMSLASYGVIIHSREASALRAGKVYLVMALVGEVLVFSAMVFVASASGTIYFSETPAAVAGSPLRDLLMALTLAGFGIKVGAIGLHMWLPLAHPAAPVPASAVLSGAMIKAGLLGWLRLLPLGETALPHWAEVCIAGGLLAAFFGAAVGVAQSSAKAVLAYSSISQMGLITIGVGIGLAQPEAWPLAGTAVSLYAFHHALAKGALFLGVGVAPAAAHRGWMRYVVFGALLVSALALAGAPLTSGAVAKTGLKYAVGYAPHAWPPALTMLLPLAAVGTTLLMARFLFLVLPCQIDGRAPRLGMMTSFFALVAAGTLAIWLLPTAENAVSDALPAGKWWPAFWPALLGVALAISAGSMLRQSKRAAGFVIPPGDVLALMQPAFRFLRENARLSAERMFAWTSARKSSLAGHASAFRFWLQSMWRKTGIIEQWSTATVLMLALAAVLTMALVS